MDERSQMANADGELYVRHEPRHCEKALPL
jgi:hypothetical protein